MERHGSIRFRPLRHDDMPLLYTWVNTAAVNQWYHKRPLSFAEVEEEFLPYCGPDDPTRGFVILQDHAPIGYIQTYLIAAYPEYQACLQVDDHTAGIDLFIGEDSWRHQGWGSQIIRSFVEQVVFADPAITCCVIAPEVNNSAAIKTYAKAGFRYLRTADCVAVEEPEYVMALDRRDWSGGRMEAGD